jgi:tRNA-binding protein
VTADNAADAAAGRAGTARSPAAGTTGSPAAAEAGTTGSPAAGRAGTAESPAAGEAGTTGATAAAASSQPITPDEFFQADIRVGVIVRAEEFPQAHNPAYKLWIDFGELGTRTSSAQLTAFYQTADLAGRLVLAVVNFPPRRVAGFPSQVLVLGVPAPDAKRVALVAPDRPVPPGTRVF